MATIGTTLCLLCTGPAGAAPTALTLEQAVDLGLRRNRDLALLALSLRSRESAVQEAADAFRFNVRPEARAEAGSNDRNRATYGFSVSRRTTWGTWAQASARLDLREDAAGADLHTGAIGVDVRQPLLRRLGSLVNREPLTQAEQATRTARREVELRKTDLVVRVVRNYGELVRLERQVRCDEATVQRLRTFARLAEVRERQGRATRLDTQRAQIRLGDSELRLRASREQHESLQAEFAELLGVEPNRTFALAPPPLLAVSVSNATDAVSCALRRRLDYAQVLQDEQDARRGVRVARRGLLPDLELITRYERLGEGDSLGGAVDLDEDVWFVGLGMTTSLPRYREKHLLARAELSERSAGVRVDAMRAAIARQVRQAVLAYQRTVAEIPAARHNHELASRHARLAQRLFEMGRADSLDVAEAEDDLRAAEARRLVTETGGSTAACRLLRVMGNLIEYPADLMPAGGVGRE